MAESLACSGFLLGVYCLNGQLGETWIWRHLRQREWSGCEVGQGLGQGVVADEAGQADGRGAVGGLWMPGKGAVEAWC